MITHSHLSTATKERMSRTRGYVRFAMIVEYLQRRRYPVAIAEIHEYMNSEIGDVSIRTTHRDVQLLDKIGAASKAGRDRNTILWRVGRFSRELLQLFDRAVDLQAELSEIDEGLQSQFKTPSRWAVTDIGLRSTA